MSDYVLKSAFRTGILVPAILMMLSCGSENSGGTGPSADAWITTVVDAEAGARYNAIAVGSDGHPTIAYIDFATATLRFARFNGTAWEKETVPGTTDADEGVDIVLDAADHPHIGWQSENGIRYAHHNGTSWAVEVVENTVVGARNPSLSIALAPGGYPAISFYGGDNFGLKYASRLGGSWSIVTADADLYAGFHGTSLVFDAAGRPVISYYEYTSSALRLARLDGTWSIEEVDNSGSVGQYSSLALDSSGRPHIAYLDETNGQVRYALKDGAGWIFEEIDSGILSPSLALAVDGTPRVAFISSAYGYVKVGQRSGTSWTVETASARTADWTVSLAVGPADRVHISAYLTTGLVHIRSN